MGNVSNFQAIVLPMD